MNLLQFEAHSVREAPFVLTTFQREAVAIHVGFGLPEAALETVVQSQRDKEREVESEVLRLADFKSTMTFPRALFERWLNGWR